MPDQIKLYNITYFSKIIKCSRHGIQNRNLVCSSITKKALQGGLG